MFYETFDTILAWSLLINLGILIFWFVMFIIFHDSLYALHSRWFKISLERFDSIHYAAMAFYKVCIFIFNLSPYLAIRIMG